MTVSLCFSDQLTETYSEKVVWECRSGAVIVTAWPGFMSLWWSVTLFHFLGCKDESRGRATCIKLVKEMGIQVCYTDVAPLKAKLERSCGETCKFCKHHKWYSHNSLNARPNRPFHRFFSLSFIKTTERISIDSGGKSALKLANLKNSKVILSEQILPHKVAKSFQTFVWLRARNCHHTTSVVFGSPAPCFS